jgi:nicotinate phosphoribosyltransferase
MEAMIMQSLFDTDHYKITMGQVIFNQFPRAQARYRFICRSATTFPEGFGDMLRREVDSFTELKARPEEIAWLGQHVRYLKPTYLEWLAGFRFQPREVCIQQDQGSLAVEIAGPWYRTVFWEVPLMAAISELYFRGRVPAEDWQERIVVKAKKMAAAGVHWADFGTRRRFSFAVQDRVNEVMRQYRPHFLGTSNPCLALRHHLTPIGTYAHEGPMAMQALGGTASCNKNWMAAWVRDFEGDLGIALTDTVTSAHFFRFLTREEAKLFDGIRQDSGPPAAIAEMAIARYQELHIDPRSKRIIFSDSLTDDKLIALHQQFHHRIMVAGGIGTFLTNDVGHAPLNMVIKLAAIDLGQGWVPVVKLSDDAGKYTGDAQRIAAAKIELGI